MFRNMNIGAKINTLFAFILLTFSAILSIVISVEIKLNLYNEANKKVSSDNALSYAFIEASKSGEWHITNGEMYKGDEKVNGVYMFVDT